MSYTISKVNGILTAKEARNQTVNNLSSTDEYLLDSVSKSITKSINDGKYYCYVYETLTPRVISQLANIGYITTNQSSQRDGEMFKITW